MVDLCVPNSRAATLLNTNDYKCMGETNKNGIMEGDFDISLLELNLSLDKKYKRLYRN